MNILILTDSLIPDSGRPGYVRSLAIRLVAAGHQVSVHAELGDSNGLPDAVAVVSSSGLPMALDQADVVHLHLPVGRELAQAVRNRRSLVIHPHDYSFACPSGSLYRPDSAQLCGRDPGPLCYLWGLETRCTSRSPGKFLPELGRAKMLSGLLEANAFWTVTAKRVREHLTSRGVPPNRVSVVGWAVDADAPSPVPQNGPVFFAGPIEEKSGIFDLLDIVLVNDVDLVIAGSGPDSERLKTAVGHAGLEKRVKFLENCPAAERRAQIRNARLVAVPSRWEEPVSHCGAEAAAAGRAAVGYHHGSWEAWAADQETALFAERGYVHELSGAVKLLLGDPMRLEKLSAAARSFYERELKWEVHLPRILSVYESARSAGQ